MKCLLCGYRCTHLSWFLHHVRHNYHPDKSKVNFLREERGI